MRKGTYDYLCTFHPYMKGKLIVEQDARIARPHIHICSFVLLQHRPLQFGLKCSFAERARKQWWTPTACRIVL